MSSILKNILLNKVQYDDILLEQYEENHQQLNMFYIEKQDHLLNLSMILKILLLNILKKKKLLKIKNKINIYFYFTVDHLVKLLNLQHY
jgi:hypothetical protein